MPDYDVIVIGGGISGLACAGYLGRAGLKTLVLENRGECGAHCDTTEPGIPGFLHNLHTTWLITAMSPAMGDLELEKYGIEYRTTDIVYAKTFADGKNVLMANDPFATMASWEKFSAHDAGVLAAAVDLFLPNLEEVTDIMHAFAFQAPSHENERRLGKFLDGFYKKIGLGATFEEVYKMNGFQVMDLMFESEHIKTMIQSLSWISGIAPIHRTVGAIGTSLLAPLTGPIYPVHVSRGGSHEVTHALVRAATAHGVKIMTCCPAEKLVVENGEVVGVTLSADAIYPNETITAKKVVSNLTVVPTFLHMMGEEVIGAKMAHAIGKFSYEEQNLFGVYYALKGAPEFASAGYDPGIQRSFMGYFGGEDSREMERYGASLLSGRIHPDIIANWFVPTLADPTQAPEGCHTSFVWLDVPPSPVSWKNGRLPGFDCWDNIKDDLADQITDTYERYAPGFKDLILDRVLYTPMDMFRNNPSAIRGNWSGGSVNPEQFYQNRPVPGVCVGGGARTFMKNLYLSNSIHPWGTSWLAPGYIAACEVAEDMGVRDQPWWKYKACQWYLENAARIPANLGVK